MATAGRYHAVCSVVLDGVLELEHEAERRAYYSGLVILPPDKLMVVDNMAGDVRLHSLQDGRQLAVYKPESRPVEICTCTLEDDENKFAVSLEFCGNIEIISVQHTNQTPIITRVKTLSVTTGLDSCNGLYYSNKKLFISGLKENRIFWGIVSITDGHLEAIYCLCESGEKSVTFLTTNKKGIVLISCFADNNYPENTGVYGFRNSERKFLYQHKDLFLPRGIAVDERGFIFVCNGMYPSCIHQLTATGQLVTIHTQGMSSLQLMAIYCDERYGHLYVTSRRKSVITRYRSEYFSHEDLVIPAEILHMDKTSLQLYKDALRDGKEKVYNIRVMVVGQCGVGKTTLTKRILEKDVHIDKNVNTEGIDVQTEFIKVSLSSGEWTVQQEDAEQLIRLQRLVRLVNDHIQEKTSKTEQEVESDSRNLATGECNHRDSQLDPSVSSEKDISPEVQLTSSQPVESSDAMVGQRRIGAENEIDVPSRMDIEDEILHLVNQNTDKLDMTSMEYATLTMWDFAGQYVFYTTHQAFLTSRAIYLLVIDLSQEISEIVKNDECFLDTEGLKQYKVRDVFEIWLNSIHSCTPSPSSGIPYVILVGTHADKIQKKHSQKVINKYFEKLRYILKDRPTIVHVMDDIAIDNTIRDPRLEELKKRIFELARQQPHWGEEKPARWLPLEQAIMTLRASGVKIAPVSLVEEINRSGSIRIEDRAELELFLRFQHDIGTILYFSIEGLKEKIILDPQWMIDALKSIITAESFIKKVPALTNKWYEFKEKGKLSRELLDAVWSKKASPEFHDNREHVLHLMEELNIIARPRHYSKDGKDIKVEDYFLAPCMLCQKTPRDLIFPKPQADVESTSVLCCVFTEKFLPSPIFHRLLAACLAHWPIAKKKSENLIFCGCCIFEVDPHHKLTLFHRDYVIFARVTKMSKRNKTPDSNVCIQVREFIDNNLSKIIGYLRQSLMFQWCIKCPRSKADSLNSLLPVSELQKNEEMICSSHQSDHVVSSQDLLKFWFDGETPRYHQQKESGHHIYAPIADEVKSPFTEYRNETRGEPVVGLKYSQHYQDKESGHTFHRPDNSEVKSTHTHIQQFQEKKLGHTIHSQDVYTGHMDETRWAPVLDQYLLEERMAHGTTRQKENLVFLHLLQRMEPKIYDIYLAVYDKNSKHEKELTIEKGDILLVLNSSCNWWKVKNYKGEVGYTSYTYLEKLSQGTTQGDTIASLPCSFLDSTPSEKQLGRLSMHIGHESFRLGLELGLSEACIQQIERDYPHVVTQCLKILSKWKQQNRHRATFKNLVTAFQSLVINLDIFSSLDTKRDTVSCLSSHLLDMQPEDRHLNRICSGLGREYIHLGVELEVPLSNIDQIIADCPGDMHKQCFKILKVWREVKARQATFRNLEQAFLLVGIDVDILKQCELKF